MIGETISAEEVAKVPLEERLRAFRPIEDESRRDYLLRLGELFSSDSPEEVPPYSYPLVEDRLPQWHFKDVYIRDLDLTNASRDLIEGAVITDDDLLSFADSLRGRYKAHGQDGTIGFLLRGKLRSDDLHAIIGLENLILDRSESLTPTTQT